MHDIEKSHILKYSINFGIFNHLSISTSAEEVATKLDIEPNLTSKLLEILTLFEVIIKKEEGYVNTLSAEKYLVEGKSTYIGDFFATSIDMNEKMVAMILYAPKLENPETSISSAYSEELWSEMTEMNTRYQRVILSY